MKKLAIIIFLVISGITDAQTPLQPYIEVVGSAEMEIIPDQIYVTITLQERYKGKTKVTLDTLEKELFNKLSELNIDLKDISLSNANADLDRVKWRQKDVFADRDYTLLLHTAEKVIQVFEKLGEMEVYDMGISKVSHSKIEEYRKTLKIQAMVAAKEKAEYLLNAIGNHAGKPFIITENPWEPVFTKNRTEYSAIYSKDLDFVYNRLAENPYQDISFQKIIIRFTVTGKFEIL